ncbi:hypothetical protein [Nocardioides sp.]|uniref:hypothetical protein n=1 Tax=Nocardioides sp. TaxID=35761 RepID=UPI00271D9D0B|nr:hypothetical protein [Nocardioides sp.]MDO9456060.1 hypothetical protein [Nocardioides sp.]
MYSSRVGATGTVVLRVDAPTRSVVLLCVHDAAGVLVLRRRVRDLRTALDLPAGAYRLTVTDERSLHDPARHAGVVVDVEVPGDGLVRATARLTRGAVLRVTTTRWARLSAVHADGERLEVRADGLGRAVLAGLRPGAWTVVAHDARRALCSVAVTAAVDAAGAADLELPVLTPTGRLLVDVRSGERRPVLATEVAVTDATGRTVTAPVRGGLADVRDLRPGPLRVVVPPSVGHHGTTLAVEVEPGTLGAVSAVVRVSAALTGRVVQNGYQYAAVVALLDEDGEEVERVRTDEDGHFAIGTGLTAANGLTVVATTGPETLHVTRAAVADVCVLNGVRHHLGEIVLPVAGRSAVWAARTPAVAGMKLPSTRV